MAGSMNPVREAIIDALDDATLALTATAGVHWVQAPQGTEPPYVIVMKVAGTREYTFEGPPILNELYIVKGVGFADDAEAMDERCQVLLDNVALAVDGRDLLLAPMPEVDVNYTDNSSGEVWQHVGTQYRIETEGAS